MSSTCYFDRSVKLLVLLAITLSLAACFGGGSNSKRPKGQAESGDSPAVFDPASNGGTALEDLQPLEPTGKILEKKDGQRFQYIDLVSDGTLAKLREQLESINNDTVKATSEELADTVKGFSLYVADDSVNLFIQWDINGEETIEFTGGLGEDKTANLSGQSTEDRPFTARVECLLADCSVATVAVYLWRKTESGASMTVNDILARLYAVQRLNDVAIKVSGGHGAGHKHVKNWLSYFSGVTDGDVLKACLDNSANAVPLQMRSWAVASGPAQFEVNIRSLSGRDCPKLPVDQVLVQGVLVGTERGIEVTEVSTSRGLFSHSSNSGGSTDIVTDLEGVWLKRGLSDGRLDLRFVYLDDSQGGQGGKEVSEFDLQLVAKPFTGLPAEVPQVTPTPQVTATPQVTPAPQVTPKPQVTTTVAAEPEADSDKKIVRPIVDPPAQTPVPTRCCGLDDGTFNPSPRFFSGFIQSPLTRIVVRQAPQRTIEEPRPGDQSGDKIVFYSRSEPEQESSSDKIFVPKNGCPIGYNRQFDAKKYVFEDAYDEDFCHKLYRNR